MDDMLQLQLEQQMKMIRFMSNVYINVISLILGTMYIHTFYQLGPVSFENIVRGDVPFVL